MDLVWIIRYFLKRVRRYKNDKNSGWYRRASILIPISICFLILDLHHFHKETVTQNYTFTFSFFNNTTRLKIGSISELSYLSITIFDIRGF
jgi:hypothetical protein